MKTTDGGNNWAVQITGANNWLSSVYFINSDTGFDVGSSGRIIKTTNGGENWDTLVSGTTNHLTSVYFTSINNGYTVGLNGTILKTTNSGNDWISVNINFQDLRSVYFVDSNIGYAVGDANFIKTTNAGNNWFFLGSYYAFSVFFVNADTGYAGSYPDQIYHTSKIMKTTNGGNNWLIQNGPPNNIIIRSIFFPSASKGYAAGRSTSMYGGAIKTTNGGGVWVEEYSDSNNIFSIYPNPAQEKLIIEITGFKNISGLTMEICNIQGQTILKQNININMTYIDISQLTKGIYIVKVESKENVAFAKFVKE